MLGLRAHLFASRWSTGERACSIETFGVCLLRAPPRFSTSDAPYAGCTLRRRGCPHSRCHRQLSRVARACRPCPTDVYVGYVGSRSGYGPTMTELETMLNKPGYSQQLVAVGLMAMRANRANGYPHPGCCSNACPVRAEQCVFRLARRGQYRAGARPGPRNEPRASYHPETASQPMTVGTRLDRRIGTNLINRDRNLGYSRN